jgi:hypothetical protein
VAVSTKEEHMALGGFTVDVDFMESLYAELVDDEGRVRKVHLLFLDANDDLTCAPMLLLGMVGDEEGLTLTGSGVLWYLGMGAIGPIIVDREYVSGYDKLGNGSFLLGDLDWRRPAEGSLWVVAGGEATCAGGLHVDDVFQSDEPFNTRPAYQYLVTAKGVSGVGRLRVRAVFDGRFNPPDLLINGNFESGASGWTVGPYMAVSPTGGRTGPYALRAAPIAKPELLTNGDFSAGASGWTLGTTFTVSGGTLVAGPNDQPQYVDDPNFLSGGGDWVGVGPNIGDVEIVNEPTEGFGGWTMRCGPVTQHQVFINADFGDGLDNWYPSSTDAEPHAVWEVDATEGVDGNACIRTTGWSTGGRPGPETIKYLRADSVLGGGVDTYDVIPGENYRAEAYFKAAPGSEGQALVSLMVIHPTVPDHDIWWHSQELDGVEHSDMRWTTVSIDNVTIPANRFDLNALVEIRNHGLGYWYVDHYTLTRTRGNRAQINYATPIPVVASTRYQLSADVRSDELLQVGGIRIGVILEGDGKPPLVVDTQQGDTDFVWTRVLLDVNPPDGYTTATPFVAALDIIGAPVWVDLVTFTKVEGNSDVTTHSSFAVVPDQRYLLSADVTVSGATRGSVTVGVTLSGDGVPDQDFEVRPGTLDDLKVKAISMEVRPPEDYDTATVFVRSTDVEGGTFAIDNIRFTKVDNNTTSTTGTTFTVIPQRTYRWMQASRSGENLQRGSVRLSVRCTGGHEDVVFDSSPMSATEGDWKFIDFSFTPPSGCGTIIPSILATDVEGDSWYLDDGEVRDTDTSTAAFDTIVSNPVGTDHTLAIAAPVGAEHVRVALAAEAYSSAWTVGGVTLQRVGVGVAVATEIVSDLLTDPDTGLPLAIGAGAITCPEIIPEDWVITNQTNRQALDALCNVIARPPLEYHVNISTPPTINVGPPANVFADHSVDSATPFIVKSTDIDVEKLPPSRIDMTERSTVVRVAGAERQVVSGGTALIMASAAVPGTPQVDWNRNPLNRARLVSDGTVDHRSYAQALADDLAAEEADPAVSLTFTLFGANSRPPTKVGDWIYVHHPEAGFEDLDNPVGMEGETVFPQRTRILTRSRSLGPSHRIVVRREDGTEFDLPGVNWSMQDSTVLTVGERRPDWQRNPSGPSAGVQYQRDRLARPR